MKEEKDIRWLQRLDNYDKAFRMLKDLHNTLKQEEKKFKQR